MTIQTIAIMNEKGGSAKTSTAVNLSAAMGEMGRKVLLVDLDGQAATSRWLGVEDDNRLADALAEGTGMQPIDDVAPNVSLAPASGKLDAVAHNLRPTQGGQLRKVLGQMTGFDFILIDCPPSLSNRLIGNALLAASHVLVPVETSILALDGLKILLTTLEDVRTGLNHNVILSGVLACRFDARTRLSGMVLGELERALPGKIFKTVIRENVRMREAPASGMSILGYAPDCRAAADYRALARELLGVEDQPAEPDGPVGRDQQAHPVSASSGPKEEPAEPTHQEPVPATTPAPRTDDGERQFSQPATWREKDEAPIGAPQESTAAVEHGGTDVQHGENSGEESQRDGRPEGWKQMFQENAGTE